MNVFVSKAVVFLPPALPFGDNPFRVFAFFFRPSLGVSLGAVFAFSQIAVAHGWVFVELRKRKAFETFEAGFHLNKCSQKPYKTEG